MQKHEREVLRVAREELANHSGFIVTLGKPVGHRPKMRLILRRGSVERYHVIASSPRDRDACVGAVRQWVRRTIKELVNG